MGTEKKLVKLTKATATKIIRNTLGISIPLAKDLSSPNVVIFRGSLGDFSVVCQNDWLLHDGSISLDFSDCSGMGCVSMFFHPETLDRDFEREEVARQLKRQSICHDVLISYGYKRAHMLVDSYCQ